MIDPKLPVAAIGAGRSALRPPLHTVARSNSDGQGVAGSNAVSSHGQAARFHDVLGAGLYTQSFYEAAAWHDLVAHLKLRSCRSLVKFGCGTGCLTSELLHAHLPPEATYLGLYVSGTMVGLAKRRLRRFGGRADVRQSDGCAPARPKCKAQIDGHSSDGAHTPASLAMRR